jgi:hypothetical protein
MSGGMDGWVEASGLLLSRGDANLVCLLAFFVSVQKYRGAQRNWVYLSLRNCVR